MRLGERNTLTALGAEHCGSFAALVALYSIFGALLLGIVLLSPRPVTAEEGTDGGNFFENDFANSPEFGFQGKGVPDQIRKGNSGETGEVPGTSEVPTDVRKAGSGDAAPAATLLSKKELRGKKIRFINAIINSKDKRHFDQAFGNLVQLSAGRKVRVGTVWEIGDSANVSDQARGAAQTIGEGVAFAKAPPPLYPVSTSPSWIMGTDEGEVIFEGFMDPDRFVNSRGELIIPGAAAEAPKPTPSAKK